MYLLASKIHICNTKELKIMRNLSLKHRKSNFEQEKYLYYVVLLEVLCLFWQ